MNSNITILSRREQIIVITTVEMVIGDQTLTLDVPHFMPNSEADIESGLDNRYLTEEQRIAEGTGDGD